MTFLFANLKDRDFLVQRISDFLQQTTSKIYLERELTSSLNSSDDEVSGGAFVFIASSSKPSRIFTETHLSGLLPAWISALQQSTAQYRLGKRANVQPERQQRSHGHTGPHDHVPLPLVGGVQPQTGASSRQENIGGFFGVFFALCLSSFYEAFFVQTLHYTANLLYMRWFFISTDRKDFHWNLCG